MKKLKYKCQIYRKIDEEEFDFVDSEDETIYTILQFINTKKIFGSVTSAVLIDPNTGLLKSEPISNIKILNFNDKN